MKLEKSIRTAFNLTSEFLIIFFNRVMMTCGRFEQVFSI